MFTVCTPITAPTDGTVSFAPALVSGNAENGTVATVACNVGYDIDDLAAPVQSTCNASSLWSPPETELPNCVPKPS